MRFCRLAVFWMLVVCSSLPFSPLNAQMSGRQQDATTPMGRTLHLAVGQSLSYTPSSRMRRIFISNPTVLDSYTVSPKEAVLTSKIAGTSEVIIQTETGSTDRFMIASDLDIEGLEPALDTAFGPGHVHAQAVQNRIILSGSVSSEAESETAVKIASGFGKEIINSIAVKTAHSPQVRLQVRIVEVDRSKLDQLGFNFLSNGKNTSALTTQQFSSLGFSPQQGQQTGNAIGPLLLTDTMNLLFYNSDLNVGATIRDLQEKQVLQILAEPTITALSGHEAQFLSGGEFPFPVVEGASTGLTSITIQFRSYGVRLAFTPFVNADKSIRLKVNPEVSALDYTNSVRISGYTIPAIATRRADTEVELKNGQSFSISGLLDHRTTQALSKMPGIGDIPILGEFFRSRETNKSVVELVVIVTPSIIDPLNDPQFPSPKLPVMPVQTLKADHFDKSLAATTLAH